MTEAEQLTCDNVDSLLELLQGERSDRKWRLFACACVRVNDVWGWLDEERSRQEVEVAERFLEGDATPKQLDKARTAAESVASRIMQLAVLAAALEDAWR